MGLVSTAAYPKKWGSSRPDWCDELSRWHIYLVVDIAAILARLAWLGGGDDLSDLDKVRRSRFGLFSFAALRGLLENSLVLVGESLFRGGRLKYL